MLAWCRPGLLPGVDTLKIYIWIVCRGRNEIYYNLIACMGSRKICYIVMVCVGRIQICCIFIVLHGKTKFYDVLISCMRRTKIYFFCGQDVDLYFVVKGSLHVLQQLVGESAKEVWLLCEFFSLHLKDKVIRNLKYHYYCNFMLTVHFDLCSIFIIKIKKNICNMHSYVLNIETDEWIFECKVKKKPPIYFMLTFCLFTFWQSFVYKQH